METNIKIILGSVVLVIAIFSGILVQFEFGKDFTTISRDGEVLAKERWHVEAERTYINLNSWYRRNIMCPRIVNDGGRETATRCYYPNDYYEQLSRSLIRTKIEVKETTVTKIVPNYAYGTSGSYAGYLIETMKFVNTDNKEEFPETYTIDWSPRDTRKYKLVWRLENVANLNLFTGRYYDCNYQFGNLKIDLKDNCKNLDYALVKDSDTIWFYFEPIKGQQFFDLGFVDPEVTLVTINSTLGTNKSSENLTVFWTSSGDVVKNITNWKLNGSSITVLNMPFENSSYNMSGDYSGFENNATLNNATWDSSGGFDGNGAFDFDGIGEYINIDNVESELENSTIGSWVAWININNTDATQEIISFGDTDGDTRIQFDINAGGQLRALLGEGGVTQWAVDTDNTVVSNDTWTHVALVQDGVEPILYVDSVLVAQEFSTSTDKTYWFGNLEGLDNGRIGDGSWNNNGEATFLNGTIDEVIIFNHSLTPEQIINIYNNQTYLLDSNETSIGDNWSACITPFNATNDGTEECSVGLDITTCACPASATNWPITMNEDCVLNVACDITGYNITLNGVGTFTVNETLTVSDILDGTNGMKIDGLTDGKIIYGAE